MVTPLIKSPFLFGPRYLQQLFEEGDLCFALEGDFFAIPADALQNPTLLASFAASTPPVSADGLSLSKGAAMWGFCDGAGLGEVSLLEPALARSVRDAASQASVYWHRVLLDEVEASGLLQLMPGGPWEDGRRQLPTLAESALLVHLLGLEGADVVPVMALAADHLLMHDLAPVSRAIGPKGKRHEPLAACLVNVIAKALRPWSFQAAPLDTHGRCVLLYLLADLATSKARKLLHEEKKHAHQHPEPGRICLVVNRALRRWQQRIVALTPGQRIVRAAATFRYLNQLRRQGDPAPLDAEVVADLERATAWP